MKSLQRVLVFVSAVLWTCAAASEDSPIVLRDGDVQISEAELRHIVDSWPKPLLESASKDVGDRFALLNEIVTARKMAKLADDAEEDTAEYLQLQSRIINLKQQFAYKRFLAQVEVPDLSTLAAERYSTQKDKYALVPEYRGSSHILVACPALTCERDEKREVVQLILERLREGESFETLVEEYSDDPGSAERGGALKNKVRLGDPSILPEYTGGLFEIGEIGEVIGPIDTRFGLHVIRLDSIDPAYYKSFEEVRNDIEADLRKEYLDLATREWREQFSLSDDAVLDGDALERIIADIKDSSS